MNKSNFQKILEDEFGDRVFSYSGRGMYGKYCVGVRMRNGSVGRFFARVLGHVDENNQEELIDCFDAMETDSLGLDEVVYFPTASFSDE